jgi:hypothetical protein
VIKQNGEQRYCSPFLSAIRLWFLRLAAQAGGDAAIDVNQCGQILGLWLGH